MVVFVKLTHLFEIKHYGYIRGIIALIIKMETFDIELSGSLVEDQCLTSVQQSGHIV